MFNPSSLKIKLQGKDNQDISPFVGIRKATDGGTEFCLPFGFDDFPIDDSPKVTKFFFSLYKTFKHFQEYAEENFKRKSPKTEGSLQKERGFTFIDKDDESVTLSSKIANLESVLTGYDELRIFSVVMRPKRTERIDYSQISRYLHQAVFLKNNAPYVDEMILPQPFIEYSITDLVRMYCFVYLEIKRQLDEAEEVPIEITNQAELFKENNLQPDSSLFSPIHDFTIQLLKAELDEIHRQVSLKDDDYWHFYKALEDFLYGTPNFDNGGIFWGIDSFALVWEDMCMVYMHETGKLWEGVWYADSQRFANTNIAGTKLFLDYNVENPFYFELNKEFRHLRPDMARQMSEVDEWFERTFKIEFENRSCHVILKDPDFISYFNYAIDPALRLRGMKQKSYAAKSFTYTPTTIEKVEEAKSLTKAKFLRRKPSASPQHLLVDFKYIPVAAFVQSKLHPKIKNDIHKQLVYEYAVYLNGPNNLSKVKSQFCLPSFQIKVTQLATEHINEQISQQGIEILKANFLIIQNFYNFYLNKKRIQQ